MNVRFTGLFQIRRECSEYGIIHVCRQVLVIYLTGSVGQADPVFLRVFPDDFMRLAKKLADEDLAVLTDTAFSLTARGFLVSNTIIGELTALLGEK